jgi:cell division protein FtsL
MQKNLADLLNYDRLKEVEGQEKQENKDVKSSQDEDIRPSSTTMQFGDDNLSNVMMDLDRQKKHEEEKNTLYLNKKGKLLLVLYSLTVAVIMALIVLNTNLLTVLNKNNVAKAEVLESKIAEFNEINAEINSVTSNEHVINVAEQEYGMIIK